MTASPDRGGEHGVSLIEMLVVVSILGVIASAVFVTILAGQRAARTGEQELQTQQVTRTSIDRVSRTIRGATYPPGASVSTAPMFDRAEADELVMYADVRGDSVAERIRFELVGDELRQQVADADCTSGCTYPAWSTVTPTVVVAGVQNAELDTAVCADHSANLDPFTYYERTSAGELVAIAEPVPDGLRPRIAAVQIDLVVKTDSQSVDTACRRLTTTAHMRNWRGV